MPVINVRGTKIAFFRWEARLANGVLVDAAKPRHISVMDIDGLNMRDLVTINAPFVDQRFFLDWAQDNWIYYSRPFTKWPNDTCVIYRVRADDSTTRQRVFSYGQNSPTFLTFFRWDISASGKRSTINLVTTKGYSNTCTDFPPGHTPALPTAFGGYYADVCCCNIACSPSGSLLGSFIDGGHGSVWWRRWSASDVRVVSQETGVSLATMSSWAGQDVLNGGSGGGMALLRWSANSDKWYCVTAAGGCRDATCGGNQVLVNHLDKKAIMTTHYPSVPQSFTSSAIVTFANAGDFWVKGPAGTDLKIEDTLGNWITIDGLDVLAENRPAAGRNRQTSPVARLFLAEAGKLAVRMADDGPCRIELFNAHGQRVFAVLSKTNMAVLPRQAVARGITLMRMMRID